MKMKIAWSKNLEMKRKEYQFQEKDQNDRNNHAENCGIIKKVKRYRSAFTTEQVNYLEKEFRKHPYIGNLRRKDVASMLSIPEKAVKIWFQNRRMKEKKDAITKEAADGQNQAKTNGIDKLLTKSASVTNEPSLPILSINEVKQIDNEVASDLRVKKSSLELTRTEKDEQTTMEFLKPNYYVANTIATSSTETSPEIAFINKNKCEGAIKSETNNAQVLQVSPEPHEMSTIFKCQSHFVSSPSTSNLPQDLSTLTSNNVTDRLNHKPVQNVNEQINGKHSIANMNIPLYLKGYYAQPYIPPGNMIWKPLNVAPIMSTGLPAVTVANSSLHQANLSSRICTCNCHLKQYSSPIVFQQSSPTPNPLVQYVITAVPLQNQNHKF